MPWHMVCTAMCILGPLGHTRHIGLFGAIWRVDPISVDFIRFFNLSSLLVQSIKYLSRHPIGIHWPVLVRVGEQGNRRAFLVTGTVITVGFEPRTLHLPGRKGISRFTRSIRHGFRVKVWMISIGLQGS